jgi:hypothetical protein
MVPARTCRAACSASMGSLFPASRRSAFHARSAVLDHLAVVTAQEPREAQGRRSRWARRRMRPLDPGRRPRPVAGHSRRWLRRRAARRRGRPAHRRPPLRADPWVSTPTMTSARPSVTVVMVVDLLAGQRFELAGRAGGSDCEGTCWDQVRIRSLPARSVGRCILLIRAADRSTQGHKVGHNKGQTTRTSNNKIIAVPTHPRAPHRATHPMFSKWERNWYDVYWVPRSEWKMQPAANRCNPRPRRSRRTRYRYASCPTSTSRPHL